MARVGLLGISLIWFFIFMNKIVFLVGIKEAGGGGYWERKKRNNGKFPPILNKGKPVDKKKKKKKTFFVKEKYWRQKSNKKTKNTNIDIKKGGGDKGRELEDFFLTETNSTKK